MNDTDFNNTFDYSENKCFLNMNTTYVTITTDDDEENLFLFWSNRHADIEEIEEIKIELLLVLQLT